MPQKRVLIGITGSVATIKLLDLLQALERIALSTKSTESPLTFEVKIVATKSALQFLSEEMRKELRKCFCSATSNKGDLCESAVDPLFLGELYTHFSPTGTSCLADSVRLTGFYIDEDEANLWKSQRVLHIMLKSWADAFLIAPLDANSMAKIANGMADNLLTCVARAWPIGAKPLLIAPAMNTDMWEHPLTRVHIEVFAETLCAACIPPVEKRLFCGDIGIGAMAHVESIAEELCKALCD